MLLAISGALAVGLAPTLIGAKNPALLAGVESAIVLICCVLEVVRRKSVREECDECGSDVEAEFISTTQSQRHKPLCRVCTDLETDRAMNYPWLTKFDAVKNGLRECCQCHRRMRVAFLKPSVVEVSDAGAVLRCDLVCKFPQSKRCEKIATQATPRSPRSPKRDQ